MNGGWVITVRPLNVRNQSPLRAGVAVDVALRRLDRTMPREQLHVAQAAAGAVDVAGRHRDEAAPSGRERFRYGTSERRRRLEPQGNRRHLLRHLLEPGLSGEVFRGDCRR
jgi:hypothetical protein